MTRETHRKMILSPFKWPLMYLPLKRRSVTDGNGFPQIGLLRSAVSRDDLPLTVSVNLTIYGIEIGGKREDKVYADVDALLDDGWEVD